MSAAITIARAGEEDREWCAGLMADSEPWLTLGRTLEQSRRICDLPDGELHVAHSASDRAGFILMFRRGVAGAPYIASIAVAPDRRRSGIGSTLVTFAEERFRGEARFIFLCVSSFNPRARALYERLGYRSVCDLTDHIVDGASETLMRKRLTPGGPPQT